MIRYGLLAGSAETSSAAILLNTFKDGFYPGLHLLPDGTIVTTTYASYRKEDIGTSIVSVRFKMSEVEAMAAKLTSGAKR